MFKESEIDRVEIDRFVGFVALMIDSLHLLDQIKFGFNDWLDRLQST